MLKGFPWPLAPALAALMMLLAAGCNDDERIAPEGATIDLVASPAQIVLANGVQTSPVTLIATVRDEIGSALPGQDVRFTSTSGILTPAAATPIRTDRYGNAVCELNGATTGPTITATSGKATDSLTLTAASGEIAQIVLSPGGFITVGSCTQTLPPFTVTVTDSNGGGVEDVTIELVFADPLNPALITGIFDPNPVTTSTGGIAPDSTLEIDESLCQARCFNKSCGTTFWAQTVGGGVKSNIVTLVDGI